LNAGSERPCAPAGAANAGRRCIYQALGLGQRFWAPVAFLAQRPIFRFRCAGRESPPC
jgi:hypothetical protein